MPTVSERKLKLLHLFRLLWEKTDSRHTLTLSQMLEELKNLGIPAERKSLYDDLETLRRFGLAIGTRKDKHFSYFLARRPFSMEELSLLLRGLQGAGLPPEQAAPLEGKVAALGSCFQAQALLQGGELPWGDEDSPAPSGALSLRERLEQAAAENRPVALTRQEWSLSDGKLVGSSGTAVVYNPNGNSYVNFRSGASLNASVLSRVPVGTKIDVLAKGTDWTKTRIDGVTGYISTWFLKF